MIKRKDKPHINGCGWYRYRYIMGLVLLVLIGGITMVFSVSCAAAKSKLPKLNPEHQEFYNYAQYLFTKDEKAVFRSLSTDEARERFIENFWEIRDPTPFTEENEFKMEMERRIEYVAKYLKEASTPGWQTDRGRIYIMLGPPTSWQEDFFVRARIIQWYYDEYNVYIRFIDRTGQGIFHMDLNTISLALLDVLDNKKNYIIHKEGNIKWETLDFDLSYDNKTREILIQLDSKSLNYDKASEGSAQMIAKIKVDLVVYEPKHSDGFFKHSEIKTAKVEEKRLLEEGTTISFKIPLELPEGKVRIDAIVTDFFSEAAYRKLVTLNVKK